MSERKNMDDVVNKWGIGPAFLLLSLGFFLVAAYIRKSAFPEGGGLYGLTWPFWFSGMLFFGLGFHLWSGAMFHIWDAIRNLELSHKGPYRLVRHPMYAGTLFMLSGAGLIWMGVIAILPALASYLLLKRLIDIEERELMDRYGEVYEEYRNQVPPIIPMLPIGRTDEDDED